MAAPPPSSPFLSYTMEPAKWYSRDAVKVKVFLNTSNNYDWRTLIGYPPNSDIGKTFDTATILQSPADQYGWLMSIDDVGINSDDPSAPYLDLTFIHNEGGKPVFGLSYDLLVGHFRSAVTASGFGSGQWELGSAVATQTFPLTMPLLIPTTPTDVNASVNGNLVTVSWTGSTTNSGGADISGYTIYNGNTVVGTVNGSTNTYSFAVSEKGTVTPGVVATTAMTIQSSAKGTGSPVIVEYLVSTPTGISATANGNLVSVSWTASTTNGGPAIDRYIIYNGNTVLDSAKEPGATSKTFATTVTGSMSIGVVATSAAGESSAKGTSSSSLTVLGGIFRYAGSAVQISATSGRLQDTAGTGADISSQATTVFDVSSTDISFSCVLPDTASSSAWQSNITYAKIGTPLFFGQLKGGNTLTFGFEDGTSGNNSNIGTVTYTTGDLFSIVLDKTQALFKINGATQATFSFPPRSGSSPIWSSRRNQCARLTAVAPVPMGRSLTFSGLSFLGQFTVPTPQNIEDVPDTVAQYLDSPQPAKTATQAIATTNDITVRASLVESAAPAVADAAFAEQEAPAAIAGIANELSDSGLTADEQKTFLAAATDKLMDEADLGTQEGIKAAADDTAAAMGNVTDAPVRNELAQQAAKSAVNVALTPVASAPPATQVATLSLVFGTFVGNLPEVNQEAAAAAAVTAAKTTAGTETTIVSGLKAANTAGAAGKTASKNALVGGTIAALAAAGITSVTLGTGSTTTLKNSLTNTTADLANVGNLTVAIPSGTTFTLDPVNGPFYLPIKSSGVYTIAVTGYSPSRTFSANFTSNPKSLTDTATSTSYVVGDTLTFGTGANTISFKVPALGSIILDQQNNAPVPCFPTGTLIRTIAGDKPVEALATGDYVLTADNRPVPVRIYSFDVAKATEANAPYVVPANSLGPRQPARTLHLSPHHAFQVRPNVWQMPLLAAERSTAITQYGIGEPVTYYHVECPNFFRDNLVADGVVCESFGSNQTKGLKGIYRLAPALGGYTRVSGPTFAKKA